MRYDEPGVYDALREKWGLTEIEPGRWCNTEQTKEVVIYEGGIMIITRTILERPEFDIVTMHPTHDITDALKAHIDDIKKSTDELRTKGAKAFVAGRGLKS